VSDGSGAAADPRLAAAAAILAGAGVPGARVRAAGHQAEVAAVAAPPALLQRVAAAAPRIKALGFRYVALELAPAPEPAP
jgi:hypothetical protein